MIFRQFSSRRAKAAALLCMAAGMLSGWASTATECPKLFHSLPGFSIDERWAKASEVYDPQIIANPTADMILHDRKAYEAQTALQDLARRQKNYEAYRLLQEAFYPLLDQINARVAAMPKEKIREIYQKLEGTNPIHTGEYVVDRRHPSLHSSYPSFILDAEVDKAWTTGIYKSVWEGLSSYPVMQNPGISRSEKLIWSTPAAHPEDFGLLQTRMATLTTPVDEYGPEFSRKLLRTTQVLMEIAADDPQLKKTSEKIFAQAKDFLHDESARTKQAFQENTPRANSPVTSALEGILSLHQLFGTLLAKKVPGAADGPSALRELIFHSGKPGDGLISEATTRFPMGLVGPMNLAGLHFNHALVRGADGRLNLAEPTIAALRTATGNSRTKSRCPMAGLWQKDQKQPGLQSLGDSYWKIFSEIDKLEKN